MTERIETELPAALDGERLDRIVAMLASVSRAAAGALVEDGGVDVDGNAVTAGRTRLRAGQRLGIDLTLLPTSSLPEPDASVAFGVVHEDEQLIVVDKPPGLVVHPAPGSRRATLVNGLLARFPDLADQADDQQRPGIVHRLDAGSSGLLAVARTRAAATTLREQFRDRSAGRKYLALVWGQPAAEQAVIDAPLGADRGDPLRRAVVASGKAARTHYQVVARFDDPAVLAELSCTLETGRTHQIRVHLAAVGHPIVGDAAYAAGRENLGLTRPYLHAAELSLVHPATGERCTWTSPLAADLATLRARLG